MKDDPAEEGVQKKFDDKKNDQPWTDGERSFIVNHVLTHVLANAGYGNIFSEVSELLIKEGYPARGRQAYQDQWRRKISKDLLSIYGSQDPATPRTPTKASGSGKAGGSPSKRKRKEEKDIKKDEQP
ncbi:hypothetical protein PSEUBRA_005709 [Kalmanozyma brasiliensis GHG001]|uniref:Myb-like domain-containing protein n=1 Tax=Kalmanozyma brasiliensis (strain GHG001) TaxID=1365824 RepID=V5EPP1_KALBG|nr:uncharacterized protein PSEUBRA_005709 [Kalmanozyma brasiliensis GHG001]EST04913.1 hypothetical protein PSEUBRA_005709 [Kalmanozyma brasiliensis GHG001]